MHIAPTGNFKYALSALKSTLPKAASYKVRVSREDGLDESEISYTSNGLEIMNALVYFREGTKVKVNVVGGVGDEWRQNAGFIFANLLGDLSFNYELELQIPLEKFDRLTSIMKRT